MKATVTAIARDWHRSAACQDAALAVCAACPVTNACLNDALAVPGTRDHGIAGGMTGEERARYRRTLTRHYLAARRKAAA